MSGIHDGHRRRLINKALKNGLDSLEQHEILEIMLFNTIPRGNTNEIAHSLLHKFGNLHNICSAEVSELKEVDGVGTKTADFLKMLPLYVKAYELSFYDNKTAFDDFGVLGRYCVNLFFGTAVEELYIIFFDINKKIIRKTKLAEGTTRSVSVNYKDIIKNAVNSDAEYVLLTHNHPNGVLIPSQNDITFTLKLRDQLDGLDIKLLDHIIVAGSEYYSFREHEIKVFN